jgi:predicted membrane metal-binding protein
VLAVAALGVMVLQPAALLGPSFQMSFAAVMALIAAYESRAPWFALARAAALVVAAGLAGDRQIAPPSWRGWRRRPSACTISGGCSSTASRPMRWPCR